MKFKINKKLHSIKKAFTLIEIMIWILIVSIVIIWWFKALTAITIWKTKLIQKTDLQKESFYFTEKLFEMIKKWWVIDYEEYFNRQVIWNTPYSSWHFSKVSWYGNFWNLWIIWTTTYWDWFYKCTSLDWNQMTWTWCVTSYHSWSIDYTWKQQRYWEYSFQFIDYNSNYDSDFWDEDGDWNVIWDDDDEYLWNWPEAFSWGIDLTELYLISWNKKERTIFRWNVVQDPDSLNTCIIATSTNIISWDGCIWNIEYLKLEWKDMWMDHSWSWSNTFLDWVIDTWYIDNDLSSWTDIIAWENNDNYWVPLFSNAINVSEFKIYAFPNIDIKNAWKNTDISSNIAPYIYLKLKLKPSWVTRKKIKWVWEELDFSMTINLSDIYSQ